MYYWPVVPPPYIHDPAVKDVISISSLMGFVNNMIRFLETHCLGVYGNKIIRALLPMLCLDGTI